MLLATKPKKTAKTLYLSTSLLFSQPVFPKTGHVARVGEERGVIGSWWGNRREKDHWGNLGEDGWIILGWISRRWDVSMWTGLGWPRIETGGGRL